LAKNDVTSSTRNAAPETTFTATVSLAAALPPWICSMSAAATVSMRPRRVLRLSPAAMRLRSACTDVKRSSHSATGTHSSRSTSTAKARASRAMSPSDPSSRSGRPTTTTDTACTPAWSRSRDHS